MSEGQQNQPKSTDPFEPFRALRDAYLDAMAKTMVEAVNTEAYAQATGAMLEGSLIAAAPLREALEKSMTQALQQMSLPSRQEVAVLAERFTLVEMRLDDMDAKLDRIEKILGRRSSAPEPPAAGASSAGVTEKATKPGEAGAASSAGRTKARRPLIRPRSARTKGK